MGVLYKVEIAKNKITKFISYFLSNLFPIFLPKSGFFIWGGGRVARMYMLALNYL